MKIILCSTPGLLVAALHAELRHQGHDVVTVSSQGQAVSRASRQSPDSCLVHLTGQVDQAGLEVVAALHAASPGTTVVLLIDRADNRLTRVAHAAGAAQVLTTSDGLASLLTALGASSHDAPRPARSRAPTAVSGPGSLTAREREVLALISHGASTTEAANALRVAPSTVRGHTQRVLEKLGVHSRVQAAAVAAEGGLLVMIPAQRTPMAPPGCS